MAGDVTWRQVPLYYMIVDELERRGGSAKDEDLYRALRGRTELTYAEFLRELMRLEMHGIVKVSVLKENLRNVELARRV